ncbi:MAG: RHS repeat-associated core domain-containing protein, partial [Anaerolineales bacterium]
VQDGPTGGGLQRYQTYTFDPFGNLTTIGGDPWAAGRSTPTSPATNRLTGGSYDGAGSLTAWQGNTYTYDAFGMMTGSLSSGEDRRFIYTAGDERLWTYQVPGGASSTWALRDLDGRVLREYDAHVSWATAKDYVYRDGQLLATSHPAEGVRHLHLDHLGTPRAVSGSASAADGFYTLTPCRVVDTRNQAAPVAAGETRIVQVAGVCGVPAAAAAVSLNMTVVDATERGEMTAMPATVVSVPSSTVISYPASLARANNAVLKLGNGALGFYSRQPAGSAHLVVDVNGYFVEGEGAAVAYHAYFPFGEELTSAFQDSEQMKFTGHERDLNNLTSVADDLDYMHARFCSPLTGRFLSVDRSGASPDPARPQSWNRYTYSLNNPLKYVDPDGQVWVSTATDPEEQARQVQLNRMLLEMGLPGPSAMAAGPRVAGFLGTRLGGLLSRLPGLGSLFARVAAAEGAVLARSVVTRETLSHALQANKLSHIFGNAEHGLGALVGRFGSEAAVTREVVGALGRAGTISVDSKGLFSVLIKVGDQLVRVEGALVNGVVKIGTFYVPPPPV